MLDIVATYHRMQFQGKLMSQTWENGKKSSIEPDYGPFGPNACHQNFFQNLASPDTRHHGQLSLCLISDKTNDRIFRKFIGGWIDRKTNGQMEGNDFLGRCPTNVERPLLKHKHSFLHNMNHFLLHINHKLISFHWNFL